MLTFTPRPPRWIARAGLVALAVAARAAALTQAPALNIDEVRYLVVAHHIRAGGGYSDWRGAETHVHPLHPALTALAGGAVETLETRGRVVTLVASVLLLWPMAVLSGRLGGPLAIDIALFLAAVHPWLVRAAPAAQPESLYVLLVASALCLLWPPETRPLPRWRWGGAGLLFGLSYLTRPEGLLVGLLACVVVGTRTQAGHRRATGPALLLLALGLASAPFLLFLRRVTGEWVLTGKTAHIFLFNQALASSGDPEEAWRIYLDLRARYGGALQYVAAHPWAALAAAAGDVPRLALSTMPRALGPACLVGLLACGGLLLKARPLRRRALLVATPCVTLGLLLLTFPNDRVAGTMVPFLIVLAGAGLADLARHRWLAGRGRRILAGVALAVLATTGWWPAVARAWGRPSSGAASLERQAVAAVQEMAGRSARFTTNNPVLSFYAEDPWLLGPPGRYRSLPLDASCARIVSEMRQEDARIAVLDLTARAPAADLGSAECPLRAALQLSDPAEDRVLTVLRLSEAAGTSR